MIEGNSWILTAVIVVLILLFGLVFILKRRRDGSKHETNYKTLFILGITWLPLGIATGNNAFFIFGLCFMGLGIMNQDKWEKKAGKQ
ncbi:LPXTG cell wall anchor domain-containing protein [Candidatus Altiarchaeota archaeon]